MNAGRQAGFVARVRGQAGFVARVRGQAGFALIIVLWTVVLLALLVVQIEQAGRNETSLAGNLRRAAALQAEADGGIAIAAYHLLGGAPGWAADGKDHVLNVDSDAYTRRLVIRISDEAGKIDLNTAPPELLQALLVAVGEDPGDAAGLATNITVWRFPAGIGSGGATANAAYKAAGLNYAPPGAPFESLDELRLVRGMTPQLLALLLPHLTIFETGPINLAAADPLVRGLYGNTAAMPNVPQAVRILAVTAIASGGSTTARRAAIIRVGAQPSGWMTILTWARPGS